MSKHQFEIKVVNRTDKTISFNGVILERATRSCRDVFMTDEFVIKFNDLHTGERSAEYKCDRQCQLENHAWRVLKKKKERVYFVPVLQYGYVNSHHYIVMPRVYEAQDAHPKWARELVDKIGEELRISDLHYGNWCVDVNGNVCIFDYALYYNDFGKED